MASTIPPPERNADPVILHPLDRLRGTIRRFVLFDGLLAAGAFLLVWFWLGLLLDFGLFKLTAFDWVLDAPRGLRAAVLLVLTLSLLVMLVRRVVLRLSSELSYPALALVLEKRFPKVLGDRLITAVELADVSRAESVGYSGEMIRETISEARERVAQVPVHSVFNWGRLQRKFLLLLAACVLLTGLSFAAYGLLGGSFQPVPFAWKAREVVSIWIERNVLLKNTPWPRSAHLELVGFEGDALRVGKDAPPPKIRVRAYEWVLSDSSVREGWRPLRWSDLTPDFVGLTVPDTVVLTEEGDWSPAVVATAGTVGGLGMAVAEKPVVHRTLPLQEMTVDEVRLQLGTTHPDAAAVFAKLQELADQPSMSRTLRHLEMPDLVTLVYRGKPTDSSGRFTNLPGTTRGEIKLTREPGGDFTGDVIGLKESVAFTVRARDFRTASKDIILLPPPAIVKLTVTERKPAYLFHPAPIDPANPDQYQPEALKGLRQLFNPENLSLTGEKSVWSVPVGTELTVNVECDKPLSQVMIFPRQGRIPGVPEGSLAPITLTPNGERFAIDFHGKNSLNATVAFEMLLTDQDGVTSRRPILLQTSEDLPPTVDLAVEVIRKVNGTYMCTPIARIPFVKDSTVSDDTGLSSVEYRYEITRIESKVIFDLQVQALSSLWTAAPAIPSLGSAVGPTLTAAVVSNLGQGRQKQGSSYLVSAFRRDRGYLPKMTLETIKQKLGTPMPANDDPLVVRKVSLQPDVDAFDLKDADDELARKATAAGRTVNRLVAEPGAIQTRYRMELSVVATDANVETGPGIGRNVEPLVFTIVSESDLLAEISKDEEGQIARLDDVIRKLKGAEEKLLGQTPKLLSPMPPPDVLLAARVRTDDIIQDIGKSRELTQGILGEYLRLRREVEVNRCNEERDAEGRLVSRVAKRYTDTVIGPLDRVLNAEFKICDDAFAVFREPLALDPGHSPDPGAIAQARNALAALIAQLTLIREMSGKDLDLNQSVARLREIIDNQKLVSVALERIKRIETEKLFAPSIQTVPAVTLKPGEKHTFKHEIFWNIYDKDSLKVKVVLPEGSDWKGPGEFTVPGDAFEVVYDLTAGMKPGEYTVKLVPEVGRTVEVMIAVK